MMSFDTGNCASECFGHQLYQIFQMASGIDSLPCQFWVFWKKLDDSIIPPTSILRQLLQELGN